MPKLDLRNAIRIKGAGGEINALKGQGFSWTKPSGDVDPILAYFQSTGADGAYYTPWDKSTLFQDEAGTIPVVNDGDPVGLMLDVSGNNKHFKQAISASRPQYRTDGIYHWLEFDGVDDYLTTGVQAPIVSPTEGITVVLATRRTSINNPIGLNQYEAVIGGRLFGMNVGSIDLPDYRGFIFNGQSFSNFVSLLTPVGVNMIITIRNSGIGTVTTASIDGVIDQTQFAVTEQDWTDQDVLLGSYRNIIYAKGRFYGLARVRTALSTSDVVSFEQQLASKTGVTL